MTEPMSQEIGGDGLAAQRRLLDEGEPELAHRELALEVAQHPTNSEAWYLLGVANFRIGRFEEAVDGFTEAARLLPTDHRAHHGLGRALEKLERHEEAARANHIAQALSRHVVSTDHRSAVAAPRGEPTALQPPAHDMPPQPADVARPNPTNDSSTIPLVKMRGVGKRLTGNYKVQFQGVVEGLEVRMEHMPGLTPPQLYVMNYVLRSTDKHRSRFPVVAVEMRGGNMQGRLHDGEEIVLDGKIDPKFNLLRGARATKKATGEVFELTGRPHRSTGAILGIIFGKVIPWIVFLATVGGILFAILAA